MLKSEFFRQALPQLFYWASDLKDVNYTEILQDETTDLLLKRFVQSIQEYTSLLSENNPDYNAAEACDREIAKLDVLIAELAPSDNQLIAAAYNLRGLFQHHILKKIEDARESYKLALEQENLHPLARASILANLSGTYSYEGNHQQSYMMRHQILVNIDHYEQFAKSADEEIQVAENHILAALHLRIAVSMSKVKDSNAVNFYDNAMLCWPESNVIANNAAIQLSKLNTASVNSLLLAEEILAKKYEAEVQKKNFVTPYYRADVAIKLAGYAAQNNSPELATHKHKAEEYLAAATLAINSYKSQTEAQIAGQEPLEYKYKPAYRTKGLARLAFQRGQLAAVCGDQEQAEQHQKSALQQREELSRQGNETIEKTIKFGQKFVPLSEISYTNPLNPALLFRKPAEEKLELEDSLDQDLQSRFVM